MTEKEQKAKLEAIERALKIFPSIVKQNAARGRSHRRLMKLFAPVTKDLARRIEKAKKPE